MEHRLFDPAADFSITCRGLPHWHQEGSYHFVTFRTADSLPRIAREAWRDERDRWLWGHGIDARAGDWEHCLATLPAADRQRFRQHFSEYMQRLLDEGHGACPLRTPALRSIVVDNLGHFDGERYTLEAFVVMPNHVHVLLGLGRTVSLLRQCRDWKRYTATRINMATRRRGPFWQTESWDHLVRSVESLAWIRRYIAENPDKAGLREGEYTAYVREARPA